MPVITVGFAVLAFLFVRYRRQHNPSDPTLSPYDKHIGAIKLGSQDDLSAKPSTLACPEMGGEDKRFEMSEMKHREPQPVVELPASMHVAANHIAAQGDGSGTTSHKRIRSRTVRHSTQELL